ncbi:MAG: LacI family DNA-binding transcriptional regulator [Peptostreptococcaceae bacterium]|nr:LacI family DNA-binding transcriptional regulator [Peptostreptococcaceae bacterium]
MEEDRYIVKKGNVTIKEIAFDAKVSIATVSMILNNKDKKISEATRNRVLEIAKDLNYIPNTMARSLITRQTKTIGLIMPDITNPFFPEIARGAEDKASQSHYSIIYCNTDDNIGREDQYINTLTEKMVDGIILAHSSDREESSYGLNRNRVPIVLIDRDFSFPNIVGKVLVNNKDASFKGVNYLLEKGYEKIVYIAGPMTTQTAKDRLDGYKMALSERGVEYRDNYVKIGDYKAQWGELAVKEFLNEGISFDSIFCGNDLIAIGAIKALKNAGMQVPEDVGIIGFDDIYMASMMDPELTTIRQPNYEMGFRAAELLINEINDRSENIEKGNMDVKKIILETELIIRKSS